MNLKLIRHWRATAAALVVLGASGAAASAAPSNYCDPLGGGCKQHFVKATPNTVKAGHGTTLSGSVGNGCKKPGEVTIYSQAFRGATKHEFAGVPAVYTRTNKKGKFSKKVTIKKSVKPGSYHVGARCGGGNLGSTKLKVTPH